MKLRSLTPTARAGVGITSLALCVQLLFPLVGLPTIGGLLSGASILWQQGILQHDLQVSSLRWLLGWTLGSIIGSGLGLLTGRVLLASFLLEGTFVLLRAIPFVALVPLMLRIFGLSEVGKVVLVIWAVASICWAVVHESAKGLPSHIRWRAITLGVSGWRWLCQILIPSCQNSIFTALRTSLGVGLIVVAVAEMGGVYERSTGLWWSEGLGYRVFRSYDIARDDYLLIAVFSFAALGTLGDLIFVLLWKNLGGLRTTLAQTRVRRNVRRILAAGEKMVPKSDVAPPVPLLLSNLGAAYDDKIVISGLNLNIAAGATLSVVGPSGCGKTTLLRAIGRFVDPGFKTAGQVLVENRIKEAPGRWVGIVFQEAPVFEHLTVWDNALLPLNGSDRELVGKTEAYRVLFEFGLHEAITQKAAYLSGGQRQRLSIAVALLAKPLVLLLDEPFGSLDAITRRQLQEFYCQHIRGKVTSVFVTHDLNEALLVGDAVSVGTTSPPQFNANVSNLPPDEWEFSDCFREQKRQILQVMRTLAKAKGPSDAEA